MLYNDKNDIKPINYWKNANIDSAIIEDTNNVVISGQIVKKTNHSRSNVCKAF